ncbi:hypothetical protein GLOTRDRAFT_139759 [Gloeophyllum trabeum ATCC 11539]|uniref:Uncharacterized protein n=1 Tax=Gloeophyllum trabeum (strain ATCC 11539 / FP-39264 / Madison 617) TaxID=670483 RepID=S7RH55_GLOTA|nr:uncharacterized protein GLOTRDRAFT_139759 [Gloeophyllum trabeum ATCC 11539]EPQ53570.1 hypothetical protein GLOTRDRAFT_139759 [Gloeophyllum trabeum ATCC 11539]
MLLDIAVFLAVLNVKKELNCSGAFKAVTALGNIAVGLASLLLMIRAVAINASKKKYMIPLAVVLGANWGTLLHAVSVADAVWDPQSSSCSPVGTSRFKPNVLTSFAADCVFMGVSFVSLLRKEGLSRLWRMLYREGLICMGVATVAYLVPSVFLLLNLNDIMNYMFQPFASIVMVTCSTRMYRELSEFLSPQVLPNPAISTLSTLEFYKPSSRVLRPGMDKSMAVRVQMETTTATESTFGTTDYTQSGDDSSSLHFARP